MEAASLNAASDSADGRGVDERRVEHDNDSNDERPTRRRHEARRIELQSDVRWRRFFCLLNVGAVFLGFTSRAAQRRQKSDARATHSRSDARRAPHRRNVRGDGGESWPRSMCRSTGRRTAVGRRGAASLVQRARAVAASGPKRVCGITFFLLVIFHPCRVSVAQLNAPLVAAHRRRHSRPSPARLSAARPAARSSARDPSPSATARRLNTARKE